MFSKKNAYVLGTNGLAFEEDPDIFLDPPHSPPSRRRQYYLVLNVFADHAHFAGYAHAHILCCWILYLGYTTAIQSR